MQVDVKTEPAKLVYKMLVEQGLGSSQDARFLDARVLGKNSLDCLHERGASPAVGFLIFMLCFGGRNSVLLRLGKNVANALFVLSCPCRKMKAVSAPPAGSSLQCQALPCSIVLSASDCCSKGVAMERRFHAKTSNSWLICAACFPLSLNE